MSEGLTIKKHVPWLYYVAYTGMMMTMNMAGIYLAFFMTERMQINAVVAASILLGARIVDLLVAMVCGAVVQKNCFKLGQYRTWLFYGPIVLSIGTIMMFLNPAVSESAKGVVVFIGFVLYGSAASFMQISQNGLLAKISGPNMTNRIALSSKIVQGQQSASILCSLMTMPLVLLFDKTGRIDGYTAVQIIYSVVGFVFSMALFIGSKEYDPYDPDFKSKTSGGGVKLTRIMGETLKNGQLITLLLADACRFAGTFTWMAMLSYYLKYVAGNLAMITTVLFAQSVTALLGAFIAPMISKRIGKRNSGLFTGLVAGCSYLALGLFARGNVYILMALNCAAYFGISIVSSVGANLYLDAGEYQLYKTGKDNRTFTMSMYGTSIKIGNLANSVIVAAILTMSGYNEVAQTVADTGRLGMLVGLAPAIFYFLYTVLIFTFKITEEKSREYATHNHQKMQEKAAG